MTVTLRILLGLAACAICVGLLRLGYQQQPIPWHTAETMAGKHWYKLLLDARHVGYFESETRLRPDGHWEFRSDLRFALSAQTPVAIQQSLRFSPLEPFNLVAAHYRVKRVNSEYAVQALHNEQTADYSIDLNRDGEHTTSTLPWTYALGDYLAVETWLQEAKPAPGAEHAFTHLDLEKLQLAPKRLALLSSSAQGYTLRNRAPNADSTIELDPRFVPLKMQLAGLFTLLKSTKTQALAERSALTQASYLIPLDQPLQDHQTLARLVVAPHSANAAAADDWPQRLELTANPLSHDLPDNPSSLLTASLNHPVDNPRLRSLLEQIELTGDESSQLRQLVQFVHNFIRYEPRANTVQVLDLLDDPSGDCGEYADLFTSLARANGMPARTVFGLAYTDSPEPALAFHAWNEVLVNQQWQAVDPTWNQIQVDATHMLLPTAERSALRLLTGHSRVQFAVLETEYL